MPSSTSSKGGKSKGSTRSAGFRKAKKPRVRVTKRHLVRWTDAMDKKLLLAIQHVFNRHGASVPWDEIGAVVGPKISGSAVTQHLAKIRIRQIEAGNEVPPPLKKGGINKSFTATSPSPKPNTLADPKDRIIEESTDNDWEDDEPRARKKMKKNQDNAVTDGNASKPSLIVTLQLPKPFTNASSANNTSSDESLNDDDSNIDAFGELEDAFNGSQDTYQDTYDPYTNQNPIHCGGMPIQPNAGFASTRNTITDPFLEDNAVFNQYFSAFPVDSEFHDAAYVSNYYDGHDSEPSGMMNPDSSYSDVAGEGFNVDGEDGGMGGPHVSEEYIFADIDFSGREGGMNQGVQYQ